MAFTSAADKQYAVLTATQQTMCETVRDGAKLFLVSHLDRRVGRDETAGSRRDVDLLMRVMVVR